MSVNETQLHECLFFSAFFCGCCPQQIFFCRVTLVSQNFNWQVSCYRRCSKKCILIFETWRLIIHNIYSIAFPEHSVKYYLILVCKLFKRRINKVKCYLLLDGDIIFKTWNSLLKCITHTVLIVTEDITQEIVRNLKRKLIN